MKRLYPIFVIMAIFMLLFASCYYDNEEALYPLINSSCDTTNITFSVTVVTLLSNNCYSCHSNNTAASSGNNIRLENFTDVVSRSASVSGSINHTGSYSPMPKNGGKMKQCSITQFDLWIKNGMPDN